MVMAVDSNYFAFPCPVPAIISIFVNILIFLSLKMPDSILLDYYGPLGHFGRHLAKNHYGVLQLILVGALAAHIGEAIYARKISLRKGLTTSAANKWMIQTFLIGFPSLLVLVPYNSEKKDS